MASILKRGKVWNLYYYDPATRKMKNFSLKTSDKTEANFKLKQWEKNQRDNETALWMKKSHTMRSGFAYYEQNCELEPGSLKITKHIYDRVVRWIGDKPLNRITREDYDAINQGIRTWISEQKYGEERMRKNKPEPRIISKHTQRMYAAHLIAVFNFFVSREWLKKHYIERPKVPVIEVEDIPQDHLRIIFGKCENSEHRDLFKFLLITGRRAGEIEDIRISDIDLEHKTINMYIQKSKKRVVLPIISELEEVIKAKMGREYLFNARNYWAIRSAWERLMKKCGFHYTLHQLRKSCATYLFSTGVDLRIISIYLTHSDVKVTQKHYTRLIREGIAKEIEEKADFSGYMGEKEAKVISINKSTA